MLNNNNRKRIRNEGHEGSPKCRDGYVTSIAGACRKKGRR